MGKVLILGSRGMLGGELLKVFGSDAIGWDREDVDVTQVESLKLKVESLKPSAIINCVAYNDVEAAEEKVSIANLLNSEVPGNLAIICKDLNIPLVHFSTNYVFDGEQGEYTELDTPNPQSIYAKSKYLGEMAVSENCEKFYIVRTSVLFGKMGESALAKKSFVDLMLEKSNIVDTIKVVNDEINSVTYAADLALAVKVLLSQQFDFGIYHLTNLGSASWYDFAKEIFSIANKKITLIPVSSTEFPRKARRPKKSVLLNTKFIEFRPWQEALNEFLEAK